MTMGLGLPIPIPADLEKKLTTTVDQMRSMNRLLIEVRDLLAELVEIEAKQLAIQEVRNAPKSGRARAVRNR